MRATVRPPLRSDPCLKQARGAAQRAKPARAWLHRSCPCAAARGQRASARSRSGTKTRGGCLMRQRSRQRSRGVVTLLAASASFWGGETPPLSVFARPRRRTKTAARCANRGARCGTPPPPWLRPIRRTRRAGPRAEADRHGGCSRAGSVKPGGPSLRPARRAARAGASPAAAPPGPPGCPPKTSQAGATGLAGRQPGATSTASKPRAPPWTRRGRRPRTPPGQRQGPAPGPRRGARQGARRGQMRLAAAAGGGPETASQQALTLG